MGVFSIDTSLVAFSVALLLEDDIWLISEAEDSCLLPDELIGFADLNKLGAVLVLGDNMTLSKSLSFLDSLMCSSRLASWSKADDFESKFLKISEDSLSVELFSCTVELLLVLL